MGNRPSDKQPWHEREPRGDGPRADGRRGGWSACIGPRQLRLAAAGVVAIALLWAALFVKGLVVPYGASLLPWLLARTAGPRLQLPGGDMVQVYYNWPGLLPRGNPRFWVVQPSWLWGKTVVGVGFADDSLVPMAGAIALRSEGQDVIVIDGVTDKNDDMPKTYRFSAR